jgi:hypothetical protein
MPPRIAIFVRGGVVQEVASDTADVLIKLLDMDSIEEGDPPDQWRPPDVVILDRQDFEAYTGGRQPQQTGGTRHEADPQVFEPRIQS